MRLIDERDEIRALIPQPDRPGPVDCADGQSHALHHGATALHAFATGYGDGLLLSAAVTFAAAVLVAVALRPRRSTAVVDELTPTTELADAA